MAKQAKALEITIGMSDWVHARLSQLPTERRITMWNTYIAGEFGGHPRCDITPPHPKVITWLNVLSVLCKGQINRQ
ncbi:MAG: hypothetical protein ACO1NT_00525 [Parapedobacter sp.]